MGGPAWRRRSGGKPVGVIDGNPDGGEGITHVVKQHIDLTQLTGYV